MLLDCTASRWVRTLLTVAYSTADCRGNRLCPRQSNDERCSRRAVAEEDAAAMRLNQRGDDSQAKTRAAAPALGREERLKDALPVAGRNAAAVIGECDSDLGSRAFDLRVQP